MVGVFRKSIVRKERGGVVVVVVSLSEEGRCDGVLLPVIGCGVATL